MASLVQSFLLVFIFASSARGNSQGSSDLIDILEVMKNFEAATAIFSTIDDANQECLVTKRGIMDDQTGSANFTWYYQGLDGSPKTKCFYNEADESRSDVFYIAPCDDRENLQEARELYTDGKICFVGRFPPVTGDQCMLWVTTEAKDSFPEICQQKFDEKCQGDKYLLYDKEKCQ